MKKSEGVRCLRQETEGALTIVAWRGKIELMEQTLHGDGRERSKTVAMCEGEKKESRAICLSLFSAKFCAFLCENIDTNNYNIFFFT